MKPFAFDAISVSNVETVVLVFISTVQIAGNVSVFLLPIFIFDIKVRKVLYNVRVLDQF
jgi:hypothetical protein